MKKMLHLVITLVMLLSFPMVVFAAHEDERDVIEVHVENQDQIMEFYDSSEYNPNYRYSFIYPNPVQPRILCPKCGKNTYKGYIDDFEWGADPKECPNGPNLTSDICTYYHNYSWSKCTTCDYTTPKTFNGIRLLQIQCYVEAWDEVIYWARPGQTVAAGFDKHEVMSTWGY